MPGGDGGGDMRAVKMASMAIAAVALAACGGSSSSSTSSRPTSPGFYIQINGMAFSPLNLHAPAGATVTVLNDDSVPHSVTSESAPNAFTPGAVAGISFETGRFTGNRSFTLPADAKEGTAIPYYCSVHTSTMATPNGTITIDTSAKPAAPPPAPGGGGGMGY